MAIYCSTPGERLSSVFSPEGILISASAVPNCREPVADFILWAYTGTGVSQSQRGKKSGEVLEKMQVNGLEG